MSVPCADLDTFFDGELSEEGAVAFREHLASCERCQAVLRGRMQEEVVAGRVEQPCVVAVKPAYRDARRRRIAILAPLLAAAAAFVIWLVVTREHEQARPIELSLTVEHRGAPRRGSVAVGDVLRPIVHGERHRAIWVYLGDRDLVAACPGRAQCDSSNGGLRLELSVPDPGRYSIIALTSAEPIMAPDGALDVMLTAATIAGAHIEIRHVDVN
jgi:hypothetical protein